MNGCAYGKVIMWCFNCDENERGCKEKEMENGGVLVCVWRKCYVGAELLKKIPYSVSVKCCAWGGKSV